MKVGDRVTITGTDHPWRGETGVIVKPAKRRTLDWIVRFQSAGVVKNVGATEDELKPVESDARTHDNPSARVNQCAEGGDAT